MRTVSPERRALALAAVLLGCNSSPDRPEREPPPQPSRHSDPAASSTASAEAPSPTGPSVAEIASGAALAAAPGSLAGVWEGRYEAKKGTVTLPPKVKDKGIAADEGKVAVGPGSIHLAVLTGGDVRGKLGGALGAGTITGKVDAGMIRAMVRPDDPLAPSAMTGVLLCERKVDAIACEIHVAGPDGTVIREANVELTKQAYKLPEP
jgi:hypothetical protein